MPRAEQPPRFDQADRLVLEEARARFEQEENRNSTYQGKTSLFLAFAGFFSALIGAALLNLLDPDRWFGGCFQYVVLALFGVALGFLFWTIETLLRSSISPGYETLATPAQWQGHLRELRDALSRGGEGTTEQVALEGDLLAAWAEAVDKCHEANEKKARLLMGAARRLRYVLVFVALGMLFFGVQAVSRPAGGNDGRAEESRSTAGEAGDPAAAEDGPTQATAEPAPDRGRRGAEPHDEETMSTEQKKGSGDSSKGTGSSPRPPQSKTTTSTTLPKRPPNISLTGNADPKYTKARKSGAGEGEA